MIALMIEHVGSNLPHLFVDITIVAKAVRGIAHRTWGDAGDLHGSCEDGMTYDQVVMQD